MDAENKTHCGPGQMAYLEQPCGDPRLLAAGLSKGAQLASGPGPAQGHSKGEKDRCRKADILHQPFLLGRSLPLQWMSTIRTASPCLGVLCGWGIRTPWSTPSYCGLSLAAEGMFLQWPSGHSLWMMNLPLTLVLSFFNFTADHSKPHMYPDSPPRLGLKHSSLPNL